ncbi:Tripartite-type tricarboxylate transporter, receptor component TctC [Variovorax sp. PDC80]|uniref:Bug family tripartite tricarboxylate transporter substrate binding protein n=1 Tax=Variovorax sp. PDC80 TaxID=1882827 RepID=UPI0008E5A687|nr:tripartite tricarboxylate transporter substrate binding protein [Variovorax sp. PDC80]SFP07881.1 Tripartite-type tricarboxylate transporter, receptor component TctC [Variovorax sp. PDC80]
MTPSKRRLLLCALAAFAAAGARAEFPSKPLRIVVQYQAGGSSDILARLVAEGLSKRLGQPVVVENRSGAGGIIGTDYVAKSAPDGHTLLLTVPGPVTANIVLYGKLPYDPRTDLRMVSDIATTRTVLAVHPSVPAKDFAGLIAVLKAAPGKYAMGSWGPGTQPHQIQVYMDRAYGLRTLHVPYKGESPMAIDLIGGVIQLTVGSIATLQPYIAAGKLRALAVAGPRRAKALPEVPTFAEQGFADEVYALTGPTSLMAPAKTPDAVVERLGREVAAVVHQPEVARRIEELGAEPVGNLPAEASAAYRAFLPVTLRLTQATGVKLD